MPGDDLRPEVFGEEVRGVLLAQDFAVRDALGYPHLLHPEALRP